MDGTLLSPLATPHGDIYIYIYILNVGRQCHLCLAGPFDADVLMWAHFCDDVAAPGCRGPESPSFLNGTLVDTNRMTFNSVITKQDWVEMHQPAFESCVKAGVASVMCSYNEINGIPSCANHDLLTVLLRQKWNFTKDYNFVVGDCGAVRNIQQAHHYNATPEAGATQALEAGTDWDCYGTNGRNKQSAYVNAVNSGQLKQSVLDTALTRVLTAHMHLGFFDSPEQVSYKRLPPETINAPAHRALARWAASRVVVLLKNAGSVLPIDFGPSAATEAARHVSIVGPNADNIAALWGDYAGPSAAYNVTARDAAIAEVGDSMVQYAPGCNDTACATAAGFSDAVNTVAGSQVVIAVMGTQGNGLGKSNPDEVEGHDRLNITLPGMQEQLLVQLKEAAVAANVPLVVVLMSGGAVSSPWADAHADAVLWTGFNGQFAGTGLFDVLAGRTNPGGRMPYTVPASVAQLPDISEYNYRPNHQSKGRTYRWLDLKTQPPLYPFGYGLSYTSWEYSDLGISTGTHGARESASARAGAGTASLSLALSMPAHDPCHDLNVTVTLTNVGARNGSEVVQLYVELSASQRGDPPTRKPTHPPLCSFLSSQPCCWLYLAGGSRSCALHRNICRNTCCIGDAPTARLPLQCRYITNEDPVYPPAPRWAMYGFERLDLDANQDKTVTFVVTPLAWSEVRPSDGTRWVAGSGKFKIYVGGGQPNQIPSRTTSNSVSAPFAIGSSGSGAIPFEHCQ